MEEVDKAALLLAEAIKNSEEYKSYIKYREEIMKNPTLYCAVNELRRDNFALQNQNTDIDMYDEVCRIYEKYAYIRTVPVVNKFLRAELSLARMVQNVLKITLKDIDFDTGFLD